MTMKKTLIANTVMTSIFITPAVFVFKEYPAGKPVTMNGMEPAAIYLQPIDMEPRGVGLPAAKADVHLEADIHAVEGDKNGFGVGERISYPTTGYILVNNDTGEKQEGTFILMVISSDLHCGANIKVMGVGNYKMTHRIEPSSKAGIHRRTDSEAGIDRWWRLPDVSYEFKYAGLN